MIPARNIRRCACWLARWVAALCLAVTVAAIGQEQSYVVKRNDTLFGIARQHGLSVAQLADRNGLSRNTQIHAGQQLIIPFEATAPARPETNAPAAALSQSVRQSLASASVTSKRWKHIVIHHSGVDEGSLKAIDRYHREERRMENGLAYHFVIGNGNGMGDGEIAVGNRWKEQLDGGHLRSEKQNKIALGICLIGNFDNDKPTDKQLRSLEQLILALLKRCDLAASAVKTHQQINIVRTECPGSKFPTRVFLARLKKPTS